MLGKRGFPLECAAAQVCREAGARLASNVFVRDMEGRRIVSNELKTKRGA